jgi:ABC-2 type transport system ATP-binding protein
MVLHVMVADNPAAAGALLAQNENVETVNHNNGFMEVSLKPGVEDYSFVPAQLVNAGFRLTMIREEEVNLETAFMRLTKGMVQ